MAIVAGGGAETGDNDENTTGGTVSVSSTVVRNGSFSFRTNPTTTATGWFRQRKYAGGGAAQGLAMANTYAIDHYLFATLPSADHEIIMSFKDSANATKLDVCITTNGYLLVLDAAGATMATGATAIDINTWTTIEAYCGSESGAATSDGPYEVRIDGGVELQGIGDVSTAACDRVDFGKTRDLNGESVDWYHEDWATADDWVDSLSVFKLTPNGDGSQTTGWAGGTGSTYAEVDDLAGTGSTDSDTTYWQSTGATDERTVTLISCAEAGVVGVIKGVKVMALVRDEGAATSFGVRLLSGATASNTTAADPGASYVYRSKMILTDPATSAAWTIAGLDAVEIGVFNSDVDPARCTALALMVFTDNATSTVTPPLTFPVATDNPSMWSPTFERIGFNS